jgi:hypothetical protein
MTNYLSTGEWLRAVKMWRSGADTLAISKKFECPEALIYALLPVYRNKYRNLDEVAA